MGTRGGYRKGSGRPKKEQSEKAKTISFSCTAKQYEEIKKLIKESGIRQNEWILSKLL